MTVLYWPHHWHVLGWCIYHIPSDLWVCFFRQKVWALEMSTLVCKVIHLINDISFHLFSLVMQVGIISFVQPHSIVGSYLVL